MDSSQVARWEHDLGETSLRSWLAHVGPTILGFVGTGPSRDPIDPRLGELDTIAVAPSAWRHGVGRRFMVAGLDDLRGAQYRECILWTLAAYEKCRSFYEATGWRATGENRDSGSQIAFRRSLVQVHGPDPR